MLAKGSFILLSFFILKGKALPSGSTDNGSNNSSIADIAPTITERDGCGQVVVNVQGGSGLAGPQGERGPPGPAGPPGAGGVSFTRWGRTTCPDTQGTELVYEGITVGSAWNHAGSAENLCLHKQPQYLGTTPGIQEERAYFYGTEYRAIDAPPALSNIAHHNAPCAVCYTPTRNTKIIIPGRTSCPPSWTTEYYGYLMAEKYHAHHRSKVPLCVDSNSEPVPGSASAEENSILYFTETTCTGIPCPPYSNGAELTCAVCTK